ncbi:MAG: MobA-like NTP transferase domain containing protein [Desulfobacteraceae bacterium]|nr:MAG: MobA-like NTP transferase domain containing protein [Desulfobacteraceae bacterium]
MNNKPVAALIFAAGKGSRMQGFEGNKTLLPLVPTQSPFQGERPILLNILQSLPEGPKGLVINHKREEVIEATKELGLTYYVQPMLNGTGGALLAAREFVENGKHERLIVTMGDVPFVKGSTYLEMTDTLLHSHMAVLGFTPEDRRQYGVLEMEGDRVRRITEWKYWKEYPREKQQPLRVCNSGIYAFHTDTLIRYLPMLAERPHKVLKEREGTMTEIQEFFVTDLVEWMDHDGLRVGAVLAEDENEVMGIDDLASLQRAQQLSKYL